jgi:hypothetical protein
MALQAIRRRRPVTVEDAFTEPQSLITDVLRVRLARPPGLSPSPSASGVPPFAWPAPALSRLPPSASRWRLADAIRLARHRGLMTVN